jgi:hypothetical protein
MSNYQVSYVASPPVKKPETNKLLMILLKNVVQFVKIFDEGIMVKIELSNMSDQTIIENAEYEGLEIYGSGTHKAVNIMDADGHCLTISNNGIPF